MVDISVVAGKYKLRIDQGATCRRRFTVATDGATPALWNLTDYTVRMDIRVNVTDEVEILECSTENGRLTIGPGPGQFSLWISDEDTATLEPGIYVYDLELESPSGDVIRLLQGSVIVSPEVTR